MCRADPGRRPSQLPALLSTLLALLPPGPAVSQQAASVAPTCDNGILISVDGLRSDALRSLPGNGPGGFAHFFEHGATTLNARTDPDFTVTLPNHTSMITGRPVIGEHGHAWIQNDATAEYENLHQSTGAYVVGVFDVAHDRGFSTTLLTGKPKFDLFDVSWNAEHGAPDTVGSDDGRDKIDSFIFTEEIEEITDGVLRSLEQREKRSLVFAHYAAPDRAGHAVGWDLKPGSKYMESVAAVDKELARIFAAIGKNERLRGRTAVVLTSDHGGRAPFRDHDDPKEQVNYVIPFLVWTSDDSGPRDLYTLNERTRSDPGTSQRQMTSPGLPPIRNGDAGNLVLGLLALPPLPDSVINQKQDLRVGP